VSKVVKLEPERTLASVNLSNDEPRAQVAQTLAAMAEIDENGQPTLFHCGGEVLRVLMGDETSPARLERLANAKDWAAEMIRCVNFVRETQSGPRFAHPPTNLIAALEGQASYPFPPIEGIARAPFFDRDGRLVETPGYHPASRLYLIPTGDLAELKSVPDRPSATEVVTARDTLRWPIRQFPYVNEASYAHAVSLMLLPFVRPLIVGPVPIHAFKAPTERTGKGKLVNCLCLVGLGCDVPVMPEVEGNADELRKRLTAIIIQDMQLAFFDNVNAVIRGGALAAILTASRWSDRILGSSKLVDLPVRTTWIVAGNNLQFSRELLLRTIFIGLDADMTDPGRRTFDPPQDPERYIKEHRAEMVHAALTLIQNWIARGRPRGKASTVLGGFEDYTRVMGGILDAADIPGFMANVSETQEDDDHEGNIWKPFLEQWWNKYGDTPTGAQAVSQLDPEMFRSKFEESDHARGIRFGAILRRLKDKVFEIETQDGERVTVKIVSAEYQMAPGRMKPGYRLRPLKQPRDVPRLALVAPPRKKFGR
jgi:hypothetical protein